MAQNDPLSSTGRKPNILQFQNACKTYTISLVNLCTIYVADVLHAFEYLNHPDRISSQSGYFPRKNTVVQSRALASDASGGFMIFHKFIEEFLGKAYRISKSWLTHIEVSTDI